MRLDSGDFIKKVAVDFGVGEQVGDSKTETK